MIDTATLRAISAARIAELGQQFLDRTRDEMDRVQQLLIRIQAGDDGARGELRDVVHRMNGAGATLGFPAVSEVASRIETLALQEQSPGTPSLAAAVALLQRRVAEAM